MLESIPHSSPSVHDTVSSSSATSTLEDAVNNQSKTTFDIDGNEVITIADSCSNNSDKFNNDNDKKVNRKISDFFTCKRGPKTKFANKEKKA